MRLYFHADSDSLFWDDGFPNDGMCEDVTDIASFQDAAAARGLKAPGKISQIIEANVIVRDTMESVAPPVTGGMAGAIQASYKKWERKPSDFYPTPFDGTESLMPLINVVLRPGAKIWEPCAGDMDMSRVLEWHGYEVTSTELRDTGQGITGIDFLNNDVEEKLGWIPDPDMIVMNPPFSLAADFIIKALSYTPNVACLVKIDYWNAISRLPLWEKNTPAFFLPLTFRLAFLKAERGNSPLMNCAWVVWLADDLREFNPNHCITEPLRKRAYPGYQGTGIRTAFAKLGQAMDGLGESMCARSKS